MFSETQAKFFFVGKMGRGWTNNCWISSTVECKSTDKRVLAHFNLSTSGPIHTETLLGKGKEVITKFYFSFL
jgi:hypothetical protein